MAVDLFDWAQKLEVVSVFQSPNKTGWVTPKVLYEPGLGHAPTLNRFKFWMLHGTVGTNTLRFWGTSGSVNNGEFTIAHYLSPKDTTVYADNKPHDTLHTIFKMVPDNRACNHTGQCAAGVSNVNAKGIEYESLQDSIHHDITDAQYIKGALVHAHDAAMHGIPDWSCVMHGIVATPVGRRSDPYAGKFEIGRHWELVQAIRREPRIWTLWNLPQPQIWEGV